MATQKVQITIKAETLPSQEIAGDIYGPYKRGAIVWLPKEKAAELIKEGKAEFAPSSPCKWLDIQPENAFSSEYCGKHIMKAASCEAGGGGCYGYELPEGPQTVPDYFPGNNPEPEAPGQEQPQVRTQDIPAAQEVPQEQEDKNAEYQKEVEVMRGQIEQKKREMQKQGITYENFLNEKGQFVPVKVADFIKDLYDFITLRDSREIFVYQNGVYVPNGESIIAEETRGFLGENATKSRVSEVLEHIRETTFRGTDCEAPKNLINMKNGYFNIDTGEFKEHSPDVVFFEKIPIEYDPGAECRKIPEFLKQVLIPEGKEPDQEGLEKVKTIFELFGYCLYREYIIHKAFCFVGEGSNGKSTVINLLKNFLGPENVSSRTLQDLEFDRFAKANLFGKLANLHTELPAQALKSTVVFKALTGGDTITREKKFQGAQTFVNYSKQVFATNQFPRTEDDTEAFWRRWTVFSFPNKFQGEKDNKKILKELTSPEELSGLFNIAFRALKELLERGDFAYTKGTDETREEIIRMSNPAQAFVMDMMEQESSGLIPKDTLYRAFLDYCEKGRLPNCSKPVFFERLPRYANFETERATIGEKRERCVKGWKIRDTPIQPEERDEQRKLGEDY